MGLPGWRTCAALVLALLVGCVGPTPPPSPPPSDDDVIRPEPVEPSPNYESHFTPRGTEVLVAPHVANQHGLFLLALQEIDNQLFYRDFPDWTVKITEDGEELVNSAMKRIVVRWSPYDDSPLPGLRSLMDNALGD